MKKNIVSFFVSQNPERIKERAVAVLVAAESLSVAVLIAEVVPTVLLMVIRIVLPAAVEKEEAQEVTVLLEKAMVNPLVLEAPEDILPRLNSLAEMIVEQEEDLVLLKVVRAVLIAVRPEMLHRESLRAAVMERNPEVSNHYVK